MNDQRPRIAIIGAGLAGLACATELRKHGYAPRVFDRGRQPGGRVSSRSTQVDHNLTVQYDHGAPMFHAHSNSFQSQAQIWVEEGIASWWSPLQEHPDGSVSNDNRVLVGVPSMNSIIQSLAEQVDLCRSTEVRQLLRNESHWNLDLQKYGDSHTSSARFDSVLLAMPATQASRLFGPAQIEGFNLLPNMLSATTWVSMMSLKLGNRLESLPDIIDSELGDCMVLTHRMPGRSMPEGVTSLVLYANRDWSGVHSELTKADMLPLMRGRVLELLSERLTQSISPSQILHQQVHRWGLARPLKSIDEPHLYNSTLRIGCCGDWFMGTDAEGAFLSGQSLAIAALG